MAMAAMATMDLQTAHANMVEQQIRPWNVLAVRTLDALRAVRREAFVPAEHRALAFADVQIALDGGEVMLEPKVGARMVEALALTGDEQALLVGAGSGYWAAVLARLCAHVTAVEIDAGLLATARKNLASAENVSLVQGDAHDGWDGEYDAVMISGSLPRIGAAAGGWLDGGDNWHATLADGGRLVGIEGELPAMSAVCLQKDGDAVRRKSLFECAVPRMRGVREAGKFVF